LILDALETTSIPLKTSEKPLKTGFGNPRAGCRIVVCISHRGQFYETQGPWIPYRGYLRIVFLSLQDQLCMIPQQLSWFLDDFYCTMDDYSSSKHDWDPKFEQRCVKIFLEFEFGTRVSKKSDFGPPKIDPFLKWEIWLTQNMCFRNSRWRLSKNTSVYVVITYFSACPMIDKYDFQWFECFWIPIIRMYGSIENEFHTQPMMLDSCRCYMP